MTDEPLDARELGIRSRAAVAAKDREAWLALFTDDAIVADPIGPSPFDPEGKGHHGRAAIAAFYDNVIATAEAIKFEFTESYLCGDEVAEVGIIRTTLAGGTHQARRPRRLHLPQRRRRQDRRAAHLLGVRRARAGRARELSGPCASWSARACSPTAIRRPSWPAAAPIAATSSSPGPTPAPTAPPRTPSRLSSSAQRRAVGLDGGDGAAARVPRARCPSASAWWSCPRACASSPA